MDATSTAVELNGSHSAPAPDVEQDTNPQLPKITPKQNRMAMIRRRQTLQKQRRREKRYRKYLQTLVRVFRRVLVDGFLRDAGDHATATATATADDDRNSTNMTHINTVDRATQTARCCCTALRNALDHFIDNVSVHRLALSEFDKCRPILRPISPSTEEPSIVPQCSVDIQQRGWTVLKSYFTPGW